MSYGYTKTDAAQAEIDGLPAILPEGNRWKSSALDHRFGEHYDGCPTYCPHFGTDRAKPKKEHTK